MSASVVPINEGGIAPVKAPGARIVSLDVFRGGTIAAMTLVNNPGDGEHVYTPFEHAQWHGWTFTDLVFPFFLWIVGVAITFSFAKRIARGDDRGKLLIHIVRRSISIYAVGLFLNVFPYFHFATARIPGVLARIAVCYLFASVIFLFSGTRGRVLWILGLLIGYWALVKLYPVPGYGPGILQPQGSLEQYVDSMFLTGHMWAHSAKLGYDPEGIVSTIPAIATALFGILAGQLLQSRRTAEEKTAWLFFAGNLLIFTGLMMSTWLPINKNLWTSSFSVFMAGMASVVFASCYWIVDVKGWRRYTKPFAIYGMNAIAVYALTAIFVRVLLAIHVNDGGNSVNLQEWIYRHCFAPLASPYNASLLYALAMVLLFYGVAYFMYRRNWFVRL